MPAVYDAAQWFLYYNRFSCMSMRQSFSVAMYLPKRSESKSLSDGPLKAIIKVCSAACSASH